MSISCPLCHCEELFDFAKDKRRDYVRCRRCFLVFVAPQYFLTPTQEKATYDLHQNSLEDEGYRQFLSRFTQPLLAALPDKKLSGLDFGCGPGPLLAKMLEEAGYAMTLYDPFYAHDPKALQTCYDFVTCTEAIEHFNTPHKEWRLLVALLKPQGILAIMTKLVIDAEAFSYWHYKNDPTHVSFFSRETFEYLAQRDDLEVDFPEKDVILLRKKI